MQQTYQCPNCGAPVAFGVKFCTNCGTSLNWHAQQHPQSPPVYQQSQQQWGYEHGQAKVEQEKPELHDGYVLSLPLENDLIHFYHASPYDVARPKVHGVEVFKVDKDKVIEYEDMCKTYRENFKELGFLRLHTPLNMYEEHQGTYFLYVPPKERVRIAGMLNGRPLISVHNADLSPVYGAVEPETHGTPTSMTEKFPPYCRVVVRGAEGLAALGLPVPFRIIAYYTLHELIGSREIVNPPEIRERIRKELQKRAVVSDEEVDKQIQAIIMEDKFFIVSLEVEGMFIQGTQT